MRQPKGEQQAESRGRQRQRAQRARQQPQHAPARDAQSAQQGDLGGLAAGVALRRERDRHAGQQGGEQGGQAQERAGAVERGAHALLHLLGGDQLSALRQRLRLHPVAPVLHGGGRAGQQQAMGRPAADAEQAGLLGVGQAHHGARRQREQLAAVGLAHQFGGDGEVAAA